MLLLNAFICSLTNIQTETLQESSVFLSYKKQSLLIIQVSLFLIIGCYNLKMVFGHLILNYLSKQNVYL